MESNKDLFFFNLRSFDDHRTTLDRENITIQY